MSHASSLALIGLLITSLGLAGCISPVDRRPGLSLSGHEVVAMPADWTFTDEFREVQVQVRAPYWLPHSVTVWCASEDGDLFIGARNAETKRWPGWVDRDPRVRLRIDGHLYEGELRPLDDPERIERLRASYRQKYQLAQVPRDGRYWQFVPGPGGE